MKYYVIINGESSLDIQGLAIESLPAISKPLMRSKREEIDGRNGDIITQLGFSAYDKTLKIGLWGNYDIDEIISYFNQDGIITFSNEPDMYYNFTILNRIDFINQLEAFRKATITIHCQPFKYKEEETEELEIITKEVSGTDISVNDSVDGAMDITLKGNTYQKTTSIAQGDEYDSPSPDHPQDINVVSGNNNIVVCGKNLYIPTITNNGETIATGNCNVSVDDDEYTLTATAGDMWFTRAVASGTAYQENQGVLYETKNATTLGFLVTNTTLNRNYFTFYDENKVSLGYTRIDSNTGSINVPNGAKYFIFRFGYYNSVSGTTYKTKVMVSYNEIPITYEAYQSQTYPINLGSIELCKIGTYQDYFYKDSGKWYLHKEIGKLVLDGSENWVSETAYTGYYRFNVSGILPTLTRGNDGFNNRFTQRVSQPHGDYQYLYLQQNNGYIHIQILQSLLTNGDVNTFRTWLSNNNTIVYYILPTSTNTEITDTTLIEQLEAIKEAQSYLGTTNINQVNNDLPFILDVSYLSGTNEITITNHGNYYSKPTLTLTGTGNINIYLNDNQIFQVALGTNETIIIDTDKMEAYYESTLKNRQVIGDYNSFKLLSGENTIRISGTFSKLQVDNYSRWI